jgi:PKD domain-containing protein
LHELLMVGVENRRLTLPARAACLWLVVGFALVLPAAASAAPPAASFSVSPPTPLTLETVTFTSTSTGDIFAYSWDLDNDGNYDDGTASTASRSFPISGTYRVALHVTGPGGEGDQAQFIPVSNRAPAASFTFFPAIPEAGELVNLVSTARDADGTITSQLWDLDGDGSFDDGSGGFASATFPAAGSYTVRLRVVDNNRAENSLASVIEVAPKPLVLATPFPVVRMIGRTTRAGLRIRRLTIEAPPGSQVEVRCRGRGCPRRSQVRKAAGVEPPNATAARLLRFRRFERTLRPRAVLRILVTKPGTIGKYTSFRVRRDQAPKRRDLCMLPGARLPSPCPG